MEDRWSFHKPFHLLRQGSRSIRHTATAAEDTHLCCRQTEQGRKSLGMKSTAVEICSVNPYGGFKECVTHVTVDPYGLNLIRHAEVFTHLLRTKKTGVICQ